MPVPIVYRKSGDQSISSYDYFDIAEGTGIKTFYCATIQDGTNVSGANLTTNDILTGEKLYSVDPHSKVTAVSTTYVLENTRTFATTFNLPKIVKGNLIINVGHSVNSGAANTTDNYIYGTVIKRSGSTDTTLGSISGAVITFVAGAGAINATTSLLSIPITLTKFKKDDILKVKIDQYCRRSSGTGTPTWYLGHDPFARDIDTAFTNSTTLAVARVPFVIDV